MKTLCILAVLLLTGCAGHHRVEEAKTCQEYGFKPNTVESAQCRLKLAEIREAKAQRFMEYINKRNEPQLRQSRPSNVLCSHTKTSTYCNTY